MYRNTNHYNFARKTPKRRKPSKALYVLFVLVIGVIFALTRTGETPMGTAEPTAELGVSTQQNSQASHPLQSVIFPEEGVYAVGTLYEGIIKTNETQDAIPMASITKVLTALVVLDDAPLEIGDSGDSITLEQKDEQYYWDYAAVLGTITGVTAGLEMSQYDILQTMLLASSNNMSDTLVDYYFGSVDAYVQAANQFLQREGFEKTRVVDATGFKPGSVSTPSEVIKLGQLALRNPVIAEIAKKKETFVPVGGGIPNYNVLIDEPDVTGLKPGFTDEAGSTLLFSADFSLPSGDTKTVIGVAMNHQDKLQFYQDTRSVLDQMRDVYLR